MSLALTWLISCMNPLNPSIPAGYPWFPIFYPLAPGCLSQLGPMCSRTGSTPKVTFCGSNPSSSGPEIKRLGPHGTTSSTRVSCSTCSNPTREPIEVQKCLWHPSSFLLMGVYVLVVLTVIPADMRGTLMMLPASEPLCKKPASSTVLSACSCSFALPQWPPT